LGDLATPADESVAAEAEGAVKPGWCYDVSNTPRSKFWDTF
jgi:hypothetical protein